MDADDGDDEDYVPPVDVPPERVFYLLIILKTSLIKREFQKKMLIQSFWYMFELVLLYSRIKMYEDQKGQLNHVYFPLQFFLILSHNPFHSIPCNSFCYNLNLCVLLN